MMKRQPLSRRTLFHSVGGIVIGLPFLEAMLTGESLAATAKTKRFVSIYSGCGTILDLWRPSGTETDFTLSPILKPLEAHKNRLIVIDGLYNRAGNSPVYGGHQGGHFGMSSGVPFNFLGQATPAAKIDTFEQMRPGGPSIDRAIFEKLKATAGGKQTSLELGVLNYAGTGTETNYVASYSGPSSAQLYKPQGKVDQAFDALFKDDNLTQTDPAAAARLRAKRKSILDSIKDQYTKLESRLGAEDKVRIDQHLTAIRDIETKLAVSTLAGQCAIPSRAGFSATSLTAAEGGDLDAYGKAQFDLMAIAIGCDKVRVASMLWFGTGGGNDYLYKNLKHHLYPTIPGQGKGHHMSSHQAKTNNADYLAGRTTVLNDSTKRVMEIDNFIAKNMAYFMTALSKYIDADGSNLLDNTLILWHNELSEGNVHSLDNMPVVLGGGVGGAFKMGKYIKYADQKQSTNDLLCSIFNAVTDSALDKYGPAALGTGPLKALV